MRRGSRITQLMVLFGPICTIVKTVAGESAWLRLSVEVPGYVLGKTVR